MHFTLSQPIKSYIPGGENDNYVIALALQTNSGFITSGDKHILSQKSSLETKYKKLKILTKAEFEKIFKWAKAYGTSTTKFCKYLYIAIWSGKNI